MMSEISSTALAVHGEADGLPVLGQLGSCGYIALNQNIAEFPSMSIGTLARGDGTRDILSRLYNG